MDSDIRKWSRISDKINDGRQILFFGLHDDMACKSELHFLLPEYHDVAD